ncbi:hypothetical protein IW262DRAFT_1413094 [Armillaria fumosa]|nr:hypothetical protein IW262DRAFT_1413094 [Armillaria fumosa]
MGVVEIVIAIELCGPAAVCTAAVVWESSRKVAVPCRVGCSVMRVVLYSGGERGALWSRRRVKDAHRMLFQC